MAKSNTNAKPTNLEADTRLLGGIINPSIPTIMQALHDGANINARHYNKAYPGQSSSYEGSTPLEVACELTPIYVPLLLVNGATVTKNVGNCVRDYSLESMGLVKAPSLSHPGLFDVRPADESPLMGTSEPTN